jgi:hypothetical protein
MLPLPALPPPLAKATPLASAATRTETINILLRMINSLESERRIQLHFEYMQTRTSGDCSFATKRNQM